MTKRVSVLDWRRVGSLAVITLALATACSSINAGAPASSSAAIARPPCSDRADPHSCEPVIRLEEGGGFAYRANGWTIRSDGTVTDDAGRIARVAPEDVASVLAEIRELGFFAHDGLSAGVPCCDLVRFRLMVDTGSHKATVEVTLGAPASVSAAIQRVRELVATAS